MPSLLVQLEDRLVAALLVNELGLGAAPRLARRYRILGLRGRGARGLVCRAVDERLEREVAIKLYADLDEQARGDEVDSEARALARLDHPNVVRVYDVGHDELVVGSSTFEVSYLVMEMVDGRSLRTYLGSPDGSHESMLRMLADVAAALEAAHARGLAHRDVKPENVMIDSAGRVRVVDFGLSRYSPKPTDVESSAAERAPFSTAHGKLVGTVEYMAPEARTGLANARSDQFSFAMMAWECLAGVLPFDGREGHWRPSDASRFDGHDAVDPALRPVLEKALSVDPKDRHSSMSVVREAFLPDRLGTRLTIGAGVAITVVIGLAIGYSFLPRDDGTRPPPRPPVAIRDSGALDARGTEAVVPGRVEDAGVTAASPCSEAAGRWEIDTVVVDSRLRSIPIGNHAYFVMEIEPIAGCDALARLTKIGDESAAGDAGPYFGVDEIRDDEARVFLRPTQDGIELDQRFGLASQTRPRRDYEFSIRFSRRRLAGDVRYLSTTGAVAYRSEVRGGRRRSETPILASVGTLPCGSRCRLSCPNNPAVVAECNEACAAGRTLAACEIDAGVTVVSRSTPPGGQPE